MPFLTKSVPLLLLAAAAAACATSTDEEVASGEADLTFNGVQVSTWDKTMPDVDAIGYDVDFTLKNAAPSHETFEATVKGTYVATRHLASLDLDFEGQDIVSVTAQNTPAPFTRQNGKLSITLPRAVDAGTTITTTVVYRGDVFQADGNSRTDFAHFGGIYVEHAGSAGTVFTSLGWPAKTRKWIPVRDHPRDGAMIAMRATFPGNLTVVANGKQKSAPTTHADGSKTWEFFEDKPLPIYDVHLSASNRWTERIIQAPESHVTVRALTYREHAHVADAVYGDQGAAVDYYAKTFGKYAWGDELRYLEEPIFSGGMENASAISIDESLFTSIDAAETRRTTFHELGHHWSGNLVRYRSWNDFWLSEGFTEYLTRRFVEDHDGAAAGQALWRTTVQAALAAETSSLHPVRPADPEKDVLGFFDDIIYEKGALVLRMIEEKMGRDAFTAFLKGWFAKHAFTAMGTDDFVNELSAATNDDWKPFFAQWVYGVSHPTLRASVVRADATHVTVTLEQTQSTGPSAGFALPVEVELKKGATSKTVTIAMTGKTATQSVELAVDPDTITVDPREQLFVERSCASNACPTALHCSSRKICQ